MPTTLTALAGILALAGGYIYFFGIPPEMKRKMEEKALETMGENKMSYMAKGQFHIQRSRIFGLQSA